MEGVFVQRYLKKGNFVLSGNIDFSVDDNPFHGVSESGRINSKPSQISLRASPSLKYFAMNKLAVSIGSEYYGTWDGHTRVTSSRLEAGLEPYLTVGERFFIVPSAKMAYEKLQYKIHTVEFSTTPPPNSLSVADTVLKKYPFNTFAGETSLMFKYFTKGASIYSAGMFYGMSRQTQKEFEREITIKEWGLRAGLEYFFAKNVSLNWKVSYTKNNNKEVFGRAFPFGNEFEGRNIDFDFSIRYFIFK